MKKLITLIMTTFLCQVIIAQVSGNINYQNQVRFPDQNININFPSSNDLYLSVKGLANVKADSYVAIFSVTQVGKTTSEVNGLIDERLSKAETEIKLKNGTEVYIDMISFVPVYEYEIEKKII